MSLNPLTIAHLGIARRPIVAALLGLWPDGYVPPVLVYVAPEGSGDPPVRQVARRRARELRAVLQVGGASLPTATAILEAVREVSAVGVSGVWIAPSLERVVPMEAAGRSLPSVRPRLLRVPVFSDDEMLALAAWVGHLRH